MPVPRRRAFAVEALCAPTVALTGRAMGAHCRVRTLLRAAHRWQVGEKIFANYGDEGDWYPGVIAKV